MSLDSVDYGRVEPFRKRVQKLDSGQSQKSPLELGLAGSFLYLDDDTTGKIYIRFNSEDAARIPVSAGFSVSGIEYRRIFVDWDAQAGKVINFVHGSGVEFSPTNDVSNIGRVDTIGEVGPFNIAGFTGWFKNSTDNAVETIVTPAANTGGIVVGLAATGVQTSRLMHHTSAPSGWADVNAMSICEVYYTSSAMATSLQSPLVIPAGRGLYFAAGGTAGYIASISYKVL